jgi:hypothetical protein
MSRAIRRAAEVNYNGKYNNKGNSNNDGDRNNDGEKQNSSLRSEKHEEEKNNPELCLLKQHSSFAMYKSRPTFSFMHGVDAQKLVSHNSHQ